MTNVITVNTIGLTDAEMLKLVSVLSSQPNIEKSIVYGRGQRVRTKSSLMLS